MDDNRDRMTDELEVEVRRSPKYSMFIIMGVLVGFIAAGILSVLPVDTSDLTADYSQGAVLGILMMLLGIVGAALGGFVALVIDRRNLKKARRYTVQAEYVARRRTAAQKAEAERKVAAERKAAAERAAAEDAQVAGAPSAGAVQPTAAGPAAGAADTAAEAARQAGTTSAEATGTSGTPPEELRS
jgi:hypothetical protein